MRKYVDSECLSRIIGLLNADQSYPVENKRADLPNSRVVQRERLQRSEENLSGAGGRRRCPLGALCTGLASVLEYLCSSWG